MTKGRGASLLLAHCDALTRIDDATRGPYARLETELGGDLTRLLVGALKARLRDARLAA